MDKVRRVLIVYGAFDFMSAQLKISIRVRGRLLKPALPALKYPKRILKILS